MRKLILELRDDKGTLLRFSDGSTRSYVENFTATDVKKVAEAIATLRPGILVVNRTLENAEARSLLSAPTGEWTCRHCQGVNPVSESLWRLQQANAVRTAIIGVFPPTELFCAHCKAAVSMETLAPPAKGCFIATAVLESQSASQLVVLQHFRDQYLDRIALGRWFIAGYYRISPLIASTLRRHPRLRALVRDCLILPLAGILSRLTPGGKNE